MPDAGSANPGHRGTVLPLVAVMSALTVGAAALAVEIGRTGDTRHGLQSTSALAAVDAVRVVDSRPTSSLQALVEDAALASAARNGHGSDHDRLIVDLGVLDPAGRFDVAGPEDIPTAVRVTAERRLDYLFMPGGRTISWTSVAGDSGGLAGVELGAFAAAVTGPNVAALNALLGAQLGGPVDLDLARFRHLAEATVSPAELAAVAGVESTDDLLARDVTPSEFLDLLIEAMDARGDRRALATIGPLSTLRAAARTAGATRAGAVPAGRLLGIGPGEGAHWADAELAVGDLVRATANEAARGQVLTLDVPVEAPGVESATVKAVVIDKGHQRFGGAGTFVEGTQLRLYIELDLGAVLGQPVRVPVSFDVARPSATIEAISCSPDGVGRAVTATVDPALAQARLGVLTDTQLRAWAAPAPATVLELPGVARIDGSAAVRTDAVYRTVVLPAPFGLDHGTRIAGKGAGAAVVLDGLDLSLVPLAESGSGLDPDTLVRPRIEAALAALPPTIAQLVAAAGLTAGGADMAVVQVMCGVPHLVP